MKALLQQLVVEILPLLSQFFIWGFFNKNSHFLSGDIMFSHYYPKIMMALKR